MRAETRQNRSIAAEAPRSSEASSPNLASDTTAIQSDKRAVQTLLWALKPLLNLRGSRSIPLPYATTFLMVALDEGQGVNAYARAFGMHRAKMSRYLRDIGRMARNGGPGLGLVAVEPHPNDPVRSQVFLTAKGRGIADAVFAQLQRLSASEQTITTSSKKDRRGNRSSNHRSGRFGRRGQSLT